MRITSDRLMKDANELQLPWSYSDKDKWAHDRPQGATGSVLTLEAMAELRDVRQLSGG